MLHTHRITIDIGCITIRISAMLQCYKKPEVSHTFWRIPIRLMMQCHMTIIQIYMVSVEFCIIIYNYHRFAYSEFSVRILYDKLIGDMSVVFVGLNLLILLKAIHTLLILVLFQLIQIYLFNINIISALYM